MVVKSDFSVHLKNLISHLLPASSSPRYRLHWWLKGSRVQGHVSSSPALFLCPLSYPPWRWGGEGGDRKMLAYATAHRKLPMFSQIDYLHTGVCCWWVGAILSHVIASAFNTDWLWVPRVGQVFKWFFPKDHLLDLWRAFQDVFTITLSTTFFLLGLNNDYFSPFS